MKRALVSVYDKDGIVEFCRALVELGWEIVSTGGSNRVLKEAGIPTIEIDEVTGFPEILGGRVKTLNPRIHGGLLCRHDREEDLKTLEEHNIKAIDMVVNNLYPFEETLKNPESSEMDIIEKIDIGGPSMIRASAKNFRYVTVIMDPRDYSLVLEELRENGSTSLETRKALAGKVFRYTSYYDSIIGRYFMDQEGLDFPEYYTIPMKSGEELRYGENPHQKAAFYLDPFEREGSIGDFQQLHGKKLSFNNINDANGALEMIKEFERPTVVAVKHANPCGIGSDDSIVEAYKKAYECDPKSIFGGILAINREVDLELAEEINKIFIEIVMAPGYTDQALEVLREKKNIRILKIDQIQKNDYSQMTYKKVLGGVLVQNLDNKLVKELQVVTKRQPTEKEMKDLEFAWKSVKYVKSNAVLLAKNEATVGIGMGQVNRIWAVESSIERAGEELEGAVLASDGFFPFKDSIEALGQAGVRAIIQPGGSIRDQECIEEADRQGIAMVFTSMRHFNH